MNHEKLKNYKLKASVHTLTIEADGLPSIPDEDKGYISAYTRSCVDREYVKTYYRINPNEAGAGELDSYSKFLEAMDLITYNIGLTDYKYTRVDFRLDCFDQSYETYLKLNRLLLGLIGNAYSVKNGYDANHFFSKKDSTIVIKNDYFDCEYYDKKAQSGGRDPAESRLELRSKKIVRTIPEIVEIDWVRRFEKAVENYEAYQVRTNKTLESLYRKSFHKPTRQFMNNTDFVMRYQNDIVSRKQLVDLFLRLGAKNSDVKAKNHMYRYGMEFISAKEIERYIEYILSCLREYLGK